MIMRRFATLKRLKLKNQENQETKYLLFGMHQLTKVKKTTKKLDH